MLKNFSVIISLDLPIKYQKIITNILIRFVLNNLFYFIDLKCLRGQVKTLIYIQDEVE